MFLRFLLVLEVQRGRETLLLKHLCFHQCCAVFSFDATQLVFFVAVSIKSARVSIFTFFSIAAALSVSLSNCEPTRTANFPIAAKSSRRARMTLSPDVFSIG